MPRDPYRYRTFRADRASPPTDSRRRPARGLRGRSVLVVWFRGAIAVVLVIVGVVWFGQGIGLIGGSFMSGQAIWAVIGFVAIVFGLALLRGVQRARHLERDGH